MSSRPSSSSRAGKSKVRFSKSKAGYVGNIFGAILGANYPDFSSFASRKQEDMIREFRDGIADGFTKYRDDMERNMWSLSPYAGIFVQQLYDVSNEIKNNYKGRKEIPIPADFSEVGIYWRYKSDEPIAHSPSNFALDVEALTRLLGIMIVLEIDGQFLGFGDYDERSLMMVLKVTNQGGEYQYQLLCVNDDCGQYYDKLGPDVETENGWDSDYELDPVNGLEMYMKDRTFRELFTYFISTAEGQFYKKGGQVKGANLASFVSDDLSSLYNPEAPLRYNEQKLEFVKEEYKNRFDFYDPTIE